MALTSRPFPLRLSDKLRDSLETEAARRGLRATELARLLIAEACIARAAPSRDAEKERG